MTHPKLALASALKASSLLASASSAGTFGSVGMVILLAVLVVLIIIVLLIVSLWKIYEKAGIPGWTVFIPLYNQVKMLEIVRKPLWWILLLFIPIVNIVLMIIMARRLAAVFGKGVGFTWGLVLLPFIFYPILAFGKSVYSNSFPAPGPMSDAVKWTLIAGFLFILVEGFGISLANSIPPTSVPLTIVSSDLGYAEDSTYVYYDDSPITGADPASFKVEGQYGMDDSAVYYDGQALPGIDPATFTVLEGGDYATTPTSVYFDGSVVSDADPATFKVLSDEDYAHDDTSVYYDGALVPGADPSTFVLVTDSSGNYNYDAKDKNSYYEEGEPVTKDGTPINTK